MNDVVQRQGLNIPAPQASTAAATVEGQRAVAEALAAVQVARSFPRNEQRAIDAITNDCSLVELAEDATYVYARGGNDITGPSIRLLETIFRRWGNVESGVKELDRQGEYSTVMAYAIDLETGWRDTKVFQVRHWRDTKRGGYALKDERDIYEVIANAGARRKRACMEAIIPPDVKEKALKQCELTLSDKIKITPDFINSLIESFGKFGVTQAMIEKRIQRKIHSMTPGHAISLRRIHNSLRDHMGEVQDWFDVGEGAPGERHPVGEQTTARSRTDDLAQELVSKRKQPAGEPVPEKKAEPKPETAELSPAESLRQRIAAAGSQEALTPLMFELAKLPAGPERDEAMRQWNARVMALKEGIAAKPEPEPTKAPAKDERPNGTPAVKKRIMDNLAKAKTRAELDDAANEITVYEWADSDDRKELEKRYQTCAEDIDL